MTALLLDIDFREGGNSADHVLDGWAEQEVTHRWTAGPESRLELPAGILQGGDVLAISATPCRNPPSLMGQTVMVALDGRLLATVHWYELQVMAFRLPDTMRDAGAVVVSFVHLNCGVKRPRPQVRRGMNLGLMVHSVRVFRLGGDPARAVSAMPASAAQLAAGFESLGLGCQFGLVQRHYGIEPFGLLRFVDTMSALLYEGLFRRFAGVEDAARLELRQTQEVQPTYRWHQQDYELGFDTRCLVGSVEVGRLLRQQVRRLDFLRRKFFEDVQLGEKIFVLTRGTCLTEPEALAVFCALTLHGPCTLLWTVFGDAARAGEVDVLAPGFMRGELGDVDDDRYGSFETWVKVMSGARVLF